MAASGSRNKRLAMVLTGLSLGMVALAFASVPLYRVFCQATGYAGTPKVDRTAANAGASTDASVVTVRFNTDIQPSLPWRFEPEQRAVHVRLGEERLAFFRADNRSAQAVTGTATFNITPNKAAQYFVKVDCFCFTEQTLQPGKGADMPVQFYVDPAIYDDPNTRDVKTLTLSYTFFRKDGES